MRPPVKKGAWSWPTPPNSTGNPGEGDQGRAQETAALKLALIGLAGSSIEYYDFLLYGTAAALVFPTIFFPATLPPFIALMASFSTFGVAFLARPVGAVLFGHLGDRMGRKPVFALALCIMGTATMLIGILPSYHTAGVFSPLALVLLRCTQGFALGGQWGGAILIATESAPKLRRGLYGSIVQAGVPLGGLLATLAFLVVNGAMSSSDFMAYGWRIPFLFSILLIGLGAFIHLRVEDTAAFREWQQTKSSAADSPPGSSPDAPEGAAKPMRGAASPVLEALRLYPRLILLAAGAYISTFVAFYLLNTYVLAYGTSAGGLHLPRSTMLTAGLFASVAALPVMVLSGAFSDRYGRRRIFMTGVGLVGIWGFLLFPLIETRSWLWIVVAHVLGAVFMTLAAAPLAAMFAELFRTAVRYSAVSLAYQIAAISGGALAPIIATGLYARYHSNVWVSVYVAGACAVSFVCASMLRETRGIGLDESPQPTGARVVST
jgi:MFS family permease